MTTLMMLLCRFQRRSVSEAALNGLIPVFIPFRPENAPVLIIFLQLNSKLVVLVSLRLSSPCVLEVPTDKPARRKNGVRLFGSCGFFFY